MIVLVPDYCLLYHFYQNNVQGHDFHYDFKICIISIEHLIRFRPPDTVRIMTWKSLYI